MANQLKYLLRKAKKFVLLTSIKNSWAKKVRSLQYDFPEELEPNSKGVFLKMLNLQVGPNEFEFILDSYNLLKKIVFELSPKIYIENKLFYIEFDDKKLNVTTAEEILIITEVYISGSYNFVSQDNLIVIDIGMNVGYASLFFASKHNVIKVYSFEPFKKTYEQGLYNLSINPKLTHKVECFNHGLSEKTETLNVSYNYENKGQVGIYGTSMIRSEVNKVDQVLINLKEASLHIFQIVKQHSQASFVLKVDCEGAEYGIFKNLFENDLLKYFKIIFIEWHENGPDELLDLLTKSGFTIFHQQSLHKRVGMIYATK